jgi:hypothetical protein
MSETTQTWVVSFPNGSSMPMEALTSDSAKEKALSLELAQYGTRVRQFIAQFGDPVWDAMLERLETV